MEVWCDWWERYEGLNGGRVQVGFYFKVVVVIVVGFLGVWREFFGGIRTFLVLFCFLRFWFLLFFLNLIPFAVPG